MTQTAASRQQPRFRMPRVEYGLHKLITSRSENIFHLCSSQRTWKSDIPPICMEFQTASQWSQKYLTASSESSVVIQSRNDPLSENNLQFCTEQLNTTQLFLNFTFPQVGIIWWAILNREYSTFLLTRAIECNRITNTSMEAAIKIFSPLQRECMCAKGRHKWFFQRLYHKDAVKLE